MRLLVTRPQPDAERTAASLRALGHSVVVAPLLHIEPVRDATIAPENFAAILVTSANAATAIASHDALARLRTLPVFAVGDRSADAMRAAGFAGVTSAAGNVEDLARVVAERAHRGAALLHLAGEDRSGDLAGALAAGGFAVDTTVVYRAVAATALPPAAAAAIMAGIDGVLHFSRRSATAFVGLARAAGLDEAALQRPAHFCLSARVAGPLKAAGAGKIVVAAAPNEAALTALVAQP